MKRNDLDEKYAQLLLEGCLSFRTADSLLIDYQTKEHDNFIKILVKKAEEMGIKKIKVFCEDRDDIANYLKQTPFEEITLQPFFDYSLFDEFAINRGCILHLSTFIPNIMSDIPTEKINKMMSLKVKTFLNYRLLAPSYNFPWCVANYPNQRWAEKLFPNDKNAYDKLYQIMMKMCMVDTENPIAEWNNYKRKNNYYRDILNSLKIKTLYYKNRLGTNLSISLPKDVEWLNLDKKTISGEPIVVNLPSYEVFTTPDNRTANGIVFNSKPLVFRGKIIEDFYLVFKDGMVVDYDSRIGKENLKILIENYKNSNRLGEVAFVDYTTRISKENMIFFDTLYDENASHHLALGNGKSSVIVNGTKMMEDELMSNGINVSPIHIDFMIGTEDMEISADTEKGKVKIISNGSFTL